MVEPAVYESVTIHQKKSTVAKIPEDLVGINNVAFWINSTGYGEARGVCHDGFRYRSVYPDGSKGVWYWASPGMYVTLLEGTNQDPEFDIPSDYVHWYHFPESDWVSGPKLHDGEELEA